MLDDFRCHPDGAYRITVAQTLAHGNNIGVDVIMLESEPFAGSSEPGCYFIDLYESIMLTDKFYDILDE